MRSTKSPILDNPDRLLTEVLGVAREIFKTLDIIFSRKFGIL